MSQSVGTRRTYTAGEVIPIYSRCRLGTDGMVYIAGESDIDIGVNDAEPAYAAGDAVALESPLADGTVTMIAEATLSPGNLCYAGAGGAVGSTATNQMIGVVIIGGSAGEYIEVQRLAGVTNGTISVSYTGARAYEVTRTNAVAGVEPSDAELGGSYTDNEGDIALVTLSDSTVETWFNDGSSWSLVYSYTPSATSAAPSIIIGFLAIPAIAGEAIEPVLLAALESSGAVDTWTVDSLPAGLSLDGSTGVVSGTPTAAGSSSSVVTATNTSGSDTITISWLVLSGNAMLDAAPSFGGANVSETEFVGVAMASINLESFNSGAAATYTVTSGSLPAGISLSSAGVLSGTASVAGSTSAVVTGTNSGGSDTLTVDFVVEAAPSFSSATASYTGTVGAAITALDLAALNTGGTATYSVTSGALAPGLSLAAGVVSGTPTTAASYSAVVTAANAAGSSQITVDGTIVGAVVSSVSFETSGAGTLRVDMSNIVGTELGASDGDFVYDGVVYTSADAEVSYNVPPGTSLSLSLPAVDTGPNSGEMRVYTGSTIESINLQHSALSTTFVTDIDVSGFPSLAGVSLQNNSLPASVLDQLLIDLDTSGVTNGTVNYSGQTTNGHLDANRSPAGAAAKASLALKAWTFSGSY